MSIFKSIKKDEYESFALKHNLLFHSLEWGEFSKAYYKLTPHYMGLVDNKKLVAIVLLLQKEIDSNYSYFFIPNDIVYEKERKDILKTIYKEIIHFIKIKKGIFLEQLSTININKYKKNKTISKNYFPLEYKSIYIDDQDTIKYINNKVKQEEYLSIEVIKGSKKDLINLSTTAPISYYETLYDIFNSSKNTKASVYIEKLHISTTINNLDKRIKAINTQISILPIDNLSESAKKKYKLLEEQKNILNKKLSIFKKYKQIYKNDTILFSNLLIVFGNIAYIIFDTNNNILDEDISGFNTYLEEINYCKNNNISIINSPLRINNNTKKEILFSYEYKTNYLLYLFLTNKLK